MFALRRLITFVSYLLSSIPADSAPLIDEDVDSGGYEYATCTEATNPAPAPVAAVNMPVESIAG